ncbi:MAG: helical backbone metal receptor [Dehalococcoidia bacterium]|nr:helical backbone metal receptor [Dehalococcoidia bacterium]
MTAGTLFGRRWRSPWASLALGLSFALVLLLAACGDDGATATPTTTAAATASAEATETATETLPASIEAVDDTGTTLVLESPAQRIVSHSPGATEILFALGAGPQVVAADEFSDYPAEAAALPKVAYASPDPEQTASHDPDLIIFSGNQNYSQEQFRGLGLPVFYLPEPTDLRGVMEHIRVLGLLTGLDQEAEALIEDLEGRLAAVEEALADLETGPRVFYELDSTLFTVGPNTFIGSAFTLLKAENIAAGTASDYPQLSAEAVVEADPEVILLADHAFGVSIESVGERPGWSGITAVEEGRIFPVDQDITSRPGPRIVDAVEALAAFLYPDRFE